MSEFYDCQPLLHRLDKNGYEPELYIVCSRVRGPGKTYSFTKHLMTTFLETGDKFILLARTRAELGNVADGMFKEMLSREFPEYHLSETKRMTQTYSEITLNSLNEDGEPVKVPCGYVIPLNSADAIKKVSSMFTDAVHAYFDEFQPEYDSTYLPSEVEKFKSVHTSIARGGGSSRRRFPVYFSSNAVTVANPYFRELGLTKMIQNDTKRFRGDGFVYERTENPGLAAKHDDSAMSRAFRGLRSSNFSDNSWVNDNSSGVTKPSEEWGEPYYIATLVNGSEKFGLKIYPDVGLMYLTHKYDKGSPNLLRMELDGEMHYQLLKTHHVFKMARDYINRGMMRYHTITCKHVSFDFLV